MIRKINLTVFITLIFSFASALFAQTAPVTGKVVLKKADGTSTPVAGALVEAFEMGVRTTGPTDKTDKKGNFSFAGLKSGSTYVLSISAPGARAGYFPNVKAGTDNILINLEEGDGRKFTEAEVRAAVEGGGGVSGDASKNTELTEEQKKAKAEYEAKVKEVEAKNQKVQKINEVIGQSLSEGNKAFQAKNYDAAIASYDAGITADPDFAGTAPILSNNKAAALTARAVQNYNQNTKLTDATAKVAAMKLVRKDFADAIASYDHSLKVLKSAQPGDIADPKVAETAKMNALRGVKETFRLMAATEQVDAEMAPKAKELFPEYIAAETEAAKKDEARIILADVYRVAGDSENAILAYRQVLETSPDNIDAMAGLGFSLVNLGYLNNDKTQLQEGANYLQKFASAAPSTHKYKDDAVGLIDTLKKEQNVAPVKGGGAKKKN